MGVKQDELSSSQKNPRNKGNFMYSVDPHPHPVKGHLRYGGPRYHRSYPVRRGHSRTVRKTYLLDSLNRQDHRIVFANKNRILDANTHPTEVSGPLFIVWNIDATIDKSVPVIVSEKRVTYGSIVTTCPP